MLDVFGFPTPQGANYQEFYGGGTVRDWVKPRGASMVRMLLIGAGGGGATSNAVGGGGGGSGAVTQWIGPAIFIPDVLRVSIGAGGAGGPVGNNDGQNGTATSVVYQAKDGTGYTLLTANAGLGGVGTGGGTAATASTNNFFGAAGIFKSIAGQLGRGVDLSITASTTTFLSGGAGGGSATTGAGGNVACNYGYPTISGGTGSNGKNGGDGFFITQPIMLGVGGAGGGGGNGVVGGAGGNGGIGCGGGGGATGNPTPGKGGRGGDGAVFIWSW
jgi:hypothetical protein